MKVAGIHVRSQSRAQISIEEPMLEASSLLRSHRQGEHLNGDMRPLISDIYLRPERKHSYGVAGLCGHVPVSGEAGA
jgi:hypothetical protein